MFALTVRRLWKLCRLLKQRPHWYSSAKERGMTFPSPILWDSSGSPDVLGYVEMKLPVGCQGRELFTSLLDLNRPWGSRGRIQRKRSSAGSVTNTCQCGRFLRALRDRFEDWSRDHSPVTKTSLPSFNRMQPRVVTCLLTGRNTLRNHLYITGLIDSSLCRRFGAEFEISAHVLCECEALTTLRLIWLSFSWTLKISEV